MIDHDDVEEIAARVAQPLRSPEHVDATFEARVMSAVQAAAREHEPTGEARRPRGWWRRQAVVRLSPLAGLAIAAGLLAAVGLGALAGWRARALTAPTIASSGGVPAASAETVHVVRFVFTDRDARSVALVGDFNGWARNATPLVQQWRAGLWTVSVAVPRGRHEYAFLVRRSDGEEWVTDPLAASVRDEFGTESSVVVVDGPRAHVTTGAS